jgi:hypothetical protein
MAFPFTKQNGFCSLLTTSRVRISGQLATTHVI